MLINNIKNDLLEDIKKYIIMIEVEKEANENNSTKPCRKVRTGANHTYLKCLLRTCLEIISLISM